MEYISLYRKYRPTNFNTVVGQKPIIRTLLNSIQQGKIAHAYIFYGSKGIGKTSIAKIFAKAVNCLNPINGDACNQCENCKLILEDKTSDIIELDAASNNGVDEVRNIIDSVGFLPTVLKYKVYIIDEAHMLTTSAWNALLKTIEEPPHHVIFIFATTEMNKIPPTILSRCQNFQFSRMTEEDAREILNKPIKNEHIKIDEASINKIIQLGNGSARDLLSILDQLCIYTNNNITEQAINEIFGLVDLNSKISFINNLISKKLDVIINQVEKYSIQGINYTMFVTELISILLDKLIYLQTNKFDNLKILNENTINTFALSEQELISYINIWQKIFIQIKNANDQKSVFLIGVFETFNLSSNQQTVSVKPNVVQSTKTNFVPTESNKPMFTTSVYKIHKPVVSKPKEVLSPKLVKQPEVKNDQSTITIKSNNLSPTDIFKHVASNATKTTITNMQSIFNKMLEDENIPACANCLMLAEKIFVASNNGIILKFNNEADAFILNKNFSKAAFQNFVIKYFTNPVYFAGFVNKDLQELTKEFRTNKYKLSELDANQLLGDENKKDSEMLSLFNKIFNK